MMSKPRVALIGLGLMGTGMARRLLGAGFPLTVYNRNPAKAAQWVAKFGAAELSKVSKLHFRTALRAQGLPEPPKIPWKKSGAPK